MIMQTTTTDRAEKIERAFIAILLAWAGAGILFVLAAMFAATFGF
jgi:hypothetical protein